MQAEGVRGQGEQGGDGGDNKDNKDNFIYKIRFNRFIYLYLSTNNKTYIFNNTGDAFKHNILEVDNNVETKSPVEGID